MRKSRFAEEDIVAILQENMAGAKTTDVIRRGLLPKAESVGVLGRESVSGVWFD